MDLMLMLAIGAVAMLLGFLGCFLPVLPGPVISYAALFVLYAFGCPLTTTQLVVGGVVLVIVTLVDYILPSICAQRFHCSRWGVFGCFVGSIVGLFFMPLGIILGPFLGTVAGDDRREEHVLVRPRRFRRASRLRSLPRAQACRRRAVRLVVFRTLAVFVVKEMICLNCRKLKPLRGR